MDVKANRSLFVLLASAISCGGTAPSTDAGGPSDAKSDVTADGSMTLDEGGFIDGSSQDTGTEPDGGCPSGWFSDGDGGCVPPSPRRPFLVGASLRMAQPRMRGDWSLRRPGPIAMPDATRLALADAWLRDALEEHASIAAFARFTMLLLSVGAPPDLVARTQRACIDELQHARACFALAERYSGQPVGPAALRIDDAIGAMSLEEIAVLTAEEGCVGETLGAILAERQLAGATDEVARATLEKIAKDEMRHADLAWRFVAWAVRVGGEPIRDAVVRAVRRACATTLTMEMRTYDVDLDLWHAHGRVTCEEARAISKAGIRDVIEPCLALLEPSQTHALVSSPPPQS
jgi:hypothetical protein